MWHFVSYYFRSAPGCRGGRARGWGWARCSVCGTASARRGTACTAPPSPSCRPAAWGCLPHVLLLELGEALQVALLIRDLVRGHLVEASGAVHAEPQEVKLLYRSLHTHLPWTLPSSVRSFSSSLVADPENFCSNKEEMRKWGNVTRKGGLLSDHVHYKSDMLAMFYELLSLNAWG